MRVVFLNDREGDVVVRRVADDADADVFPGKELFNKYRSRVTCAFPDICYSLLELTNIVADAVDGNADAGIAEIRLDDDREVDRERNERYTVSCAN